MAIERGVMTLLLVGVSSIALAGRPFQTDDPEPVDLHHLEFYVASQQTLTASGRSGTPMETPSWVRNAVRAGANGPVMVVWAIGSTTPVAQGTIGLRVA